jgi:hypothetical protein
LIDWYKEAFPEIENKSFHKDEKVEKHNEIIHLKRFFEISMEIGFVFNKKQNHGI